jgi:hypothetical protein
VAPGKHASPQKKLEVRLNSGYTNQLQPLSELSAQCGTLSAFNRRHCTTIGETQLMSNATRTVNPQVDELPPEIAELQKAMQDLPAEHRLALEPLLLQVVESAQRRRRILTLVQDALSQLRLDMKYLLFDLEATRRERDEYRRKVEEA